jgi:hypothetical protein
MNFCSASQLIIVSLEELLFALFLSIRNSEAVPVLLVLLNFANGVFTLFVLLSHGNLWLTINVVSLVWVGILGPLLDDS